MAAKKFLSESGFKHFVEKVIGKTDISSIGDGTIKDAVSSLNLKMDGKLSYKQIAIAKPKSTIKITVPYNSAGFIVFNGAISQLFSVWQYCAYSNGLAGKSIVEQGTSVSYNSSGNVLTISNNSSGNSLSLECLLFYGDFPSLTF